MVHIRAITDGQVKKWPIRQYDSKINIKNSCCYSYIYKKYKFYCTPIVRVVNSKCS